jgi:hypothetical protein
LATAMKQEPAEATAQESAPAEQETFAHA